jgi:DNA-directed RNA polymerase subunit RPC12/RpoP
MDELELLAPKLTNAVNEMVVLEWLVADGAEVQKDQPIMLVETDKANLEIRSHIEGFVRMEPLKKGDVIQVGQKLALIVPSPFYIPPKKIVESGEMDDLYAVTLRLGVICEHCNSAIPVNGFVNEVKCKCNETTVLQGKLRWEEILNYQNPGIDIFKATKKHNPGEGDYGAWQPVKLKTWRKWPECVSCKKSFNQDEVRDAVHNGGVLDCKQCSAKQQMKPAPEFIKKVFPDVLYSVDELPVDTNVSGGHIASSKPIVMSCMSCGGSLSIDGTARLATCNFCGSGNYLPDDLWFSLHPQPKMEDWVIVYGSVE